MLESQIPALVEEYMRLSKAKDMEEGKRFPSKYEIDRCEDQMAAIETRLQKSGYDINTYL